MRRFARTIAVVAAMVLMAAPAGDGQVSSQEPTTAAGGSEVSRQGPTTYGPGVLSCGTWNTEKARESTGHFMMQGWVLGYISAVATLDFAQKTSLLVQPADSAAILSWMDKHCAENPLDRLSLAVTKLVAATRGEFN